MKERPILFQGDMVRALLAGTKTQTRRIAKGFNYVSSGGAPLDMQENDIKEVPCPYGQPGDRLWVRESHEFGRTGDGFLECIYKADGSSMAIMDAPFTPELHRGRPSIHMPRWASRITLEITGVRVERLQDISEADAADEGCGFLLLDYERWDGDPDLYRKLYRVLWEQINGPGSWDANPWVWVVEFKVIKP